MATDPTVAIAVALVVDAGLRASVKPPVEEIVGAAALVAAAGAAGTAAAAVVPRGLSVKARPPAAAVVVTVEVLGAKVTAAPKVKPVLAGVGAAAAMGAAKREEPEIVAAWVERGGAGVDEGLIPKANPPP